MRTQSTSQRNPLLEARRRRLARHSYVLSIGLRGGAGMELS